MNRTFRKRPAPRRARPARAGCAPAPPEPPAAGAELLEQLLERIARGGRLCRQVEQQLRQHPCPELDTIITLYRSLVLMFSGQAPEEPEKLKLVSALMKPVLEWARLEEKRKQRELAELKYRDDQADRQSRQAASNGPKVLAPVTLEQIEHELHFF